MTFMVYITVLSIITCIMLLNLYRNNMIACEINNDLLNLIEEYRVANEVHKELIEHYKKREEQYENLINIYKIELHKKDNK